MLHSFYELETEAN